MTSFSSAISRRAGLFPWRAVPAAVLLLSAACSGVGDAMTAHTDVVARAAGKELRVEEAAEILSSNPQIPPDPQVVQALADLWVDYTLLGTAVAEDTTLSALDLASFIEPVREQALVLRLREQVIHPDTAISDAEVERRWATEGPGVEIRARHILLRIPNEATPAQRDSVEQLAASLRGRAAAGESFEQLATEFSQDPGSAARGGDLGFFSRGRMVEPFEEAAFALQPGEVSEVVESPFGYHIILLEERRQPELGDDRAQFRDFLVQQSIQEAEIAYLDSLANQANVQTPASNFGVVREIAGRPERALTGRQADRAIGTYDGGAYTAGEFASFIRGQPPQIQSAFATATDEQLESAIGQLVQTELLMDEVRKSGITLTPQEDEEIRSEARQMIRDLVEATGFAEAARQGASSAALEEHVTEIVRSIVTGESPFVPLGRLGISLREVFPHEINEGSFPAVVSRLEQIRAQQPVPMQLPTDPASPGEVLPGAPAPGMQAPAEPAPADTQN